MDPGDLRADGSPTPSCRLTYPVYGNAPTTWNATGWRLFDNATSWATTCGDDLPPQIALTSPLEGARRAGSVSLSASASDDVAVASVAFSVDGTLLVTDTNGADGWQATWDSTTVTNATHTVTARGTDSSGKQASSSVMIRVNNQPPSPGSVVMVVANPAGLTSGEARISQRWEANGFGVTRIDDDTVTAGADLGASLVFVSQSASSNSAAVKSLSNVAVPVWVAKPYLFDDFGITGAVAGSDYGDKPGNALTIVTATHPISNRPCSGSLVPGTGFRVSWGMPTTAAVTVAATRGWAPVISMEEAAAKRRPSPWSASVLPGVRSARDVECHRLGIVRQRHHMGSPVRGRPPPPPTDRVDQVVLISVDGLNPQAITQLGAAGAPTFHRLMSEGASTLNARTLFEATQTLPNHTSMFSGRRVTLPGGHGVTFNEDDGGTVHSTAGNYVDGVFSLVHDHGGSTAMYVGKEKFDFLDRSWDGTYGASDVTGADNGRDKIDVYERASEATSTSRLIARLQTAVPTFSFLHLAKPDSAGHASGFMSPQYVQAVADTDAWIGQVLDSIVADPESQRDDRHRDDRSWGRRDHPFRRNAAGELHRAVLRLGSEGRRRDESVLPQR